MDAQSSYEYEKMRGDADKLNEKLINISTAIMQTYQVDDERESLSTLLDKPDTKEREAAIREFMVKTIQGSPYITDIVLLDTQKGLVYSQSNILSQAFDSVYDWSADPFTKKVIESRNGVLFQKSHKMPGVNLNREVCTFGHKIVDSTSGNPKNTVGIILMQVPSDKLFEPPGGHEGREEGKTFIVDNEKHLLYTNKSTIADSLAVGIYNRSQSGDDSVFDRYLVRSKKLVSWSGFTYVNLIDKDALFGRNFRQILWNILPVLLGCILVCFLAINLSVYHIGKRLDRIVDYTRVIQSGDLKQKLSIDSDDEFTSIEQGLNEMTVKLNHYIEEKYISDIALKKAQIQSLQLQMNPHFMFNTLENIRSMAVSSKDWKSADMISVLGDMYRWNLHKPDVVILEDELEYLGYYTELQESRFEGRLHYVQEIPDKYLECRIPKLTLQPIVENCLNHGFTPEMEQCRIFLRAWSGDEHVLFISISDNGLGMTDERVAQLQKMILTEKESNSLYHIGMRNIHQRIRLLSGEEYGINILSEEKEGTTIIIRLPFITKEESKRS